MTTIPKVVSLFSDISKAYFPQAKEQGVNLILLRAPNVNMVNTPSFAYEDNFNCTLSKAMYGSDEAFNQLALIASIEPSTKFHTIANIFGVRVAFAPSKDYTPRRR